MRRPSPSRRSVVPRTPGPCRLSPVPAGGWPFPTLSLQSLRRRLDPYPAASLECTCPFLPREHRPHATKMRSAREIVTCNATSTGSRISGLQSFVYLQAPTLARPPDCIHRSIRAGRPGRLHHASPGWNPFRDVASLRVRLGQLTRLACTSWIEPCQGAPIRLQLNDVEIAQQPVIEARGSCRGSLEPSRDGGAGMARHSGGRRNADALDS